MPLLIVSLIGAKKSNFLNIILISEVLKSELSLRMRIGPILLAITWLTWL